MSILGRLKTAYSNYQADAEKRSERRMESLRTKTARQKEELKLKRELALAKKNYNQARTAAAKADAPKKEINKKTPIGVKNWAKR